MNPKVYLPWLGEFGIELLYYVPAVYGDESPNKIVCYEKGKENLYPKNDVKFTIDRIPPEKRGCNGMNGQEEIFNRIRNQIGPGEYIMPKRLYQKRKWFVPGTIKDYGFDVDVVIFPRRRHVAARKNYKMWPEIVEMLKAEGLSIFAAGHRDSSFHVDCVSAWDYENDLDATIWALKNSQIRIGRITALTVLSLLCGMKPTVMTTSWGTLAEGGRDKPNWSYLKTCDHMGVGYNVIEGSEEPFKILGGIVNEIRSSSLMHG